MIRSNTERTHCFCFEWGAVCKMLATTARYTGAFHQWITSLSASCDVSGQPTVGCFAALEDFSCGYVTPDCEKKQAKNFGKSASYPQRWWQSRNCPPRYPHFGMVGGAGVLPCRLGPMGSQNQEPLLTGCCTPNGVAHIYAEKQNTLEARDDPATCHRRGNHDERQNHEQGEVVDASGGHRNGRDGGG